MLAAAWSLALAALAALAVAVDCACPRVFEPLNKTMRRLAMSGSMTWRGVDEACFKQFGWGFEMLGLDVMRLTDGDRASCQGRSVPLRVEQEPRRPVVWTWSRYFRNENELVNSTYLERMRTDSESPRTKDLGVGSLNLTTGQWRLVDKDTAAFDCAVCQRVWANSFWTLGGILPERPWPFFKAFTFRLVATGSDSVDVDEAIHRAEERLNGAVNRRGTRRHVKIAKVASDPGGGNGTLLRLKSTTWRVYADDVITALNSSHSVESWWDVDYCPARRIQGRDWRETLRSVVEQVQLPDFHVATRRCSWRFLPDGDWDADWDDDILLWIDRKKQCGALGVSILVRRIQELVERADHGHLDPTALVEVTDDVRGLDLPDFDWHPYLVNVSQAIVGVLSSLLVATTTNASRACHGHTCAFLAADFQGAEGPDTLLISRKGAPLRVLSSNASDAANQTPFMSLHLPRALTSVDRVAVHAWQDLKIVDRFTGNYYKMAEQVVLSRPYVESEPERSRPAVTFKVNNINNIHFGRRYRSVFSLGESEESTLSCPLVSSEGWVDTYWCNKWARGPRNESTGTFMAVRGWDFQKPYGDDRVLLGYTTIPLHKSSLLKAAEFTESLLKPSPYERDKPDVAFLTPWEEILSGVVLTEERVLTASLDHVKVLVSDLTVSDPVVGFFLDRLDGAGAMQPVVTVAGSRNVSAESEVELVLGAGVQQRCQQLAVLAVSGVEAFLMNGSLEAYIKKKLMVVYLVVTSRAKTEASSGNVYFEIQIQVEVNDDDKVDSTKVNDNGNQSSVAKPKLRLQVATWSESARDWLVSSCFKLRSTRASKPVVRCESLRFADQRFRGRYLVFEPVGFAEAFGKTLLGVLIAAGILSGVSLASIAATAAALPAWRKDLGHKILLQMALALSFNLALGFQSSLVYVDTASVACVAVGALRHFSYLAMFSWMLVMSGLQLRRMLSMLGSRTTSNLLVKVSVFAWGVPTIAVVTFLASKTDMYRSDAADRGYCYPEGVAFSWSVQAPAATVLALNGFIFLVILARVYGCCGWGETKDLQRHLKERTVQMRRLKAVFYTFLLFGMTWTFHLLAEQGVFQDKYLYEYLFLMTASVHLFSLSCIFVFFDPEARAEWAKVVAPVRDRWVA